MAKKFRDSAQREDRDGFRFRGGHCALDLTSTLAARLQAAPRERLEEPADLGRWLVAAELAKDQPRVADDDLEKARVLREAIFSLATTCLDGKDAPSARKKINELAALPAAAPQLIDFRGVQLVGSTAALLSTVARGAVELFGGAQSSRIKQCASSTCTILFLDSSRAGDRRWCSMAGCGNLAKVREFRRRATVPEFGPGTSE